MASLNSSIDKGFIKRRFGDDDQIRAAPPKGL